MSSPHKKVLSPLFCINMTEKKFFFAMHEFIHSNDQAAKIHPLQLAQRNQESLLCCNTETKSMNPHLRFKATTCSHHQPLSFILVYN
ncbi:hypothetical protein HYC85_001767 [Camellia sinensis]|uniref:Uncharacterized protein n=1 Tax=Camellia sinensis TaxID=4442 RepID=A0A7J7I8Q6_CAMSI|nr:hypothetical protein HYC85_001767 [Camellia sinensis]